MTQLPAQENMPYKKAFSKSHIGHGALIGAMVAFTIVIIIFSISSGLSGKNEGNSVLVTLIGIFVLLIIAPLMIITGGSFELHWVAMPWYFVLRHLMPADMSIALGFIINSALIGASIAHFKWQRKQSS